MAGKGVKAGHDAIEAFGAPFAGPGEAEWRALVAKVLNGAPFDKLVSKTYDGITFGPLSQRATSTGFRPLRGDRGVWRVMTRIDHADPAEANRQALADLEGGATGLHLVMAGSAGAHGFGLESDAALQTLAGVDLAGAALEIDAGADGARLAAELAAFVERANIDPSRTRIGFGVDPIGAAALTGETPPDAGQLAASLGNLATTVAGPGFHGPLCVADARIVHQAGGSEAQEIAYALSTALAYLRALEAAGLSLERARDMIGFRLAVDADEFFSIGKLRALRTLWAGIESACGLEPKPAHIHAETAWRMMTRRDPWVNVLRATVATFSAAVGGADAISVLPLTQTLGLPDATARRLARNVQLVLLDESNLGRVEDPAAGAGAFEDISAALCAKSWSLFQDIEHGGGIAGALRSGTLKDAIADVQARRAAGIARRQEPITGTSEFASVQEADIKVLTPLSAQDSWKRGNGLAAIRLAEPFEHLRERADAFKRTTGAFPKIFLANLGPVAAFSARATWARNVFEAGGIEALACDGLATPEAAAKAFAQSGARLACICSSDAIYAEQAVACARALKKAGARWIGLAGRPGELEAALREAGISGFAFAGCDAVSTLGEALDHTAAD
ncbi:methylmalonyl-CoA mutase family protein [Roseiarcaceae bacterium H3SJ34-1]|uniref:methylmalonyl-CoA mutase family protein n=1 Tax=Terripilifer ovatus TaxID=3032367 RepID=UPI003AB9B43F|nr:methylmalonyl-CoA mutase family protein [Roseiarcaceae bacterium H3SJ34-1]